MKRRLRGPVAPIAELEPFDPSFRKAYDHFYQPSTPWPKLSVNSLRLSEKYKLDLDEFNKELAPLRSEIIELDSRLPYSKSYRGIGFTSPSGSDNPMYSATAVLDDSGRQITTARGLYKGIDKVNLDRRRNHNELEFSALSPHTPPSLVNYLKKFHSETTKIRLMLLEPGFGVRHHVDIPYYEQIRLQIPIEGNDDVIWYVEDQPFKIQTDGVPVWYDTGVSHSILNHGSSIRIVLCIHLLLYKKRSGELRFPIGTPIEDIISSGAL